MFSAVLYSCKKEKETSQSDENFCNAVNSQNFDSTGTLISNYLATLGNGSQSEKLTNLTDWLKAKSCVANALLLCNSCIETLPPQSEINVIYIVNGQEVSMTMDILMSDPLRFRTYHELK